MAEWSLAHAHTLMAQWRDHSLTATHWSFLCRLVLTPTHWWCYCVHSPALTHWWCRVHAHTGWWRSPYTAHTHTHRWWWWWWYHCPDGIRQRHQFFRWLWMFRWDDGVTGHDNLDTYTHARAHTRAYTDEWDSDATEESISKTDDVPSVSPPDPQGDHPYLHTLTHTYPHL